MAYELEKDSILDSLATGNIVHITDKCLTDSAQMKYIVDELTLLELIEIELRVLLSVDEDGVKHKSSHKGKVKKGKKFKDKDLLSVSIASNKK